MRLCQGSGLRFTFTRAKENSSSWHLHRASRLGQEPPSKRSTLIPWARKPRKRELLTSTLVAHPRSGQPDGDPRHAGDRRARASVRQAQRPTWPFTTGPDGGKVAGLVLKTRTGLVLVPSPGSAGDPGRHARECALPMTLARSAKKRNYLFLQQDLIDRQDYRHQRPAKWCA